MPLAVRTEQWRVHHLARSIPPNQRTPQTTCQSRSHDGCPDTFRQPRAFAYLLRFNNEKIDKVGSTWAFGSRPMRPTTVTATGVGEGDNARSPEDVRAALLQRKAARRAAGRAALRTAVSDDEKAARSAALYAARRARAEAARRACARPERGRPGLVLTADEVDAIERRRQEASSSLRTAHTRMAAAPPPCTELERWRPIDQRPFWARPEFRALLWPPPPPPPTTTDVVSDDGISDDGAAPDGVLEVAEVPLPRLVDEFSRVEGAEALADLGQSDRPVAGAAVVVGAEPPCRQGSCRRSGSGASAAPAQVAAHPYSTAVAPL